MRLAIFSLFAVGSLSVQPAAGQSSAYSIAPSKQEKLRIKEGVQAMHDALIEGNVDVIVEKTYPPLIRISGGEEVFRTSIEQAIQQLKTDGMKFENYLLGEPSQMYLAGSEWVCFVPQISVALIQGKRVRLTGFIIGVKGGNSSKWRYLEGKRLQRDPSALWRIFPDLPQTVKIPPIKQELLGDKTGIPK